MTSRSTNQRKQKEYQMAKEWNATTSRDEEKSESEHHQQKVSALAYNFWEARGCPEGTSEEDWSLAERELLLYIWIIAS